MTVFLSFPVQIYFYFLRLLLIYCIFRFVYKTSVGGFSIAIRRKVEDSLRLVISIFFELQSETTSRYGLATSSEGKPGPLIP